MSSTNASPTKTSANANLAGLEGCLGPSRTHSQANNGESRITNAACTETNHDAYNLSPSSSRWTYRSANSVSVEPACSYAPQNSDAKMNSTTTAEIRRQSSRV